MLRRRGKSPKLQRHETPGPAQARSSRRRPRPDVPVPSELKLRQSSPPSEPQPRSGKRGVQGVVLVTGFDPFGGEKANPSWEICTRLPASIAGLRVETCRVPCEFRRAIEAVTQAIERHRPVLVISLGQAGGRAQLSVERVAINIDDARLADNAGASPIDEPIAAGGPAAYFATIPVKAVTAAIRAAGVPAQLSNSAGTYVCNHLMYGVLHFLAHRAPSPLGEGGGEGRVRAGFIHVPYAEQQVLDKPGVASMAIETMAKAVEAAIAAAATVEQDARISEGRLD
ncbi:MAG TPA: pyroglutamyl-peptidase I [Usitatibacter sp.]|nr:pyroglutamyl-peptidase I [Usitatibacter sp.]